MILDWHMMKKNKVFALAPNESWIVDRFVDEWNKENSDIAVTNPNNADVIWLFADWVWNHISQSILTTKKVVTTIHHIVPDKFNRQTELEFKIRDIITTVYTVPNESTKNFISNLTCKPIHVIPYWANQKIWKLSDSKDNLRKKYNIPLDTYVVGSFQRDTEGDSISTGDYRPKLEKGPDLFVDYVKHLSLTKNVHVVLSGWRRQYVIQSLEKLGINYSYFELPPQELVNELYQTLDLYPVTSRYEGGPQSLIECGLLQIPVVSRDIGMASQILPLTAINNDVIHAMPSIPNVDTLKLPQGFKPYRELFESL